MRGPIETRISCALLLSMLGCDGPQSALAPAARDAQRMADLFWGMTIAGALIWLAVTGLAIYAAYGQHSTQSERGGRLLIVGAGVVVPTLLLCGLLVYSLTMLPSLLASAPAGSLTIHVTAEQYWWRVRYLREGREPVELANELRLPLNQPVNVELESRDVIHSFWVPALAGKVDAIPGRKTRLRLQAGRAGRYRGVCAEYCGTSHAFMAFWVMAQEPRDFERWLSEQAEPAAVPTAGIASEGAQRFVENGCGACHSVRGTSARGQVGPDLTHVGSRLSLAAATLENSAGDARRFIASPERVKPGVRMPAFHMLPPEHLDTLSHYLQGLK